MGFLSGYWACCGVTGVVVGLLGELLGYWGCCEVTEGIVGLLELL